MAGQLFPGLYVIPNSIFLHLIDAVNVRLIRTGSERMRRDHHQISPGSNPGDDPMVVVGVLMESEAMLLVAVPVPLVAVTV